MFSYNPDPHFTMESRPFSAHIDFSSSSSPPFFPLSPLAFNHDTTFHDLFFPQLDSTETHSPLTPPAAPAQPIKEMAPPPEKNTVMVRKQATRKDRHRKIVTAQGSRDRRMRLNLEVAPQFFDIQDMLGYDKASKTVQWLMKEAKDSIDKLKAATRAQKDNSLRGGCSTKSTEASTSELECEDISAVSDYKGKSSACQQENIIPKAKRVRCRPSRRVVYPSSLGRESRAKARERARERTEKKKNSNMLTERRGDNSSGWNQLFSTSVPFQGIDEESGSHDVKSSLDLVAVEEQCSPSTNRSKQLINNGGRVDEFSVSILDYNYTMCLDTTNLFPAEQWASRFTSTEDVSIQSPLW